MGLETSPDLYFHTPKHIFISNEDKNSAPMVHTELLTDEAKRMASQSSAGLQNKIFTAFEKEREAHKYVRIRTHYKVL